MLRSDVLRPILRTKSSHPLAGESTLALHAKRLGSALNQQLNCGTLLIINGNINK